jgi:glycosyltransferase involved in cell wall biosynthesis
MQKVISKEKLRVLYVDHTAKLGGGEIAIRNLIQGLDRSTIEPVFLSFEEGPLVDQLRGSVSMHVVALKSSVASASRQSLGVGSLLKFGELAAVAQHIRQVAQKIRELKVDLVHTNSLKSDIIGGLAGRLAGVPVIWHVRDRIAPDYLPAKVVKVFRALSRVIPKFLIAVSEASLATIVSGKDDSSRAAVVYDGLSAAQLAGPGVATASEASVRSIGLVGRICPWKGQHIFLEAAAQVHREFPEVRFEIIGGPLFGEEQYEQELKDLAAKLQLNDVVHFTGFVHDVPRRIAGLEIMVHASTISEPFGLVAIEAMAQSKPLIATRGGGIPEIVIDRETGLLIPMNDADALALAMLSLLRDPASAKEMGRRGRIRVERHFTLAQTVRDVEQIYRRVLGLQPLSQNQEETDGVILATPSSK